MTEFNRNETTQARGDGARGVGQLVAYPVAFSISATSAAAGEYLLETAARTSVQFFEGKGLAAMKEGPPASRWVKRAKAAKRDPVAD